MCCHPIRHLACAMVAGLGLTAAILAQTPEPVTAAPSQKLARDAAVHFALQNNPTLRSARNQRGFAEAGILDVSVPSTNVNSLVQLALDQRPDLKARRSAVDEAQAGKRLVEANRYGNPSFGPYYEFDPTRISYIGFRMGFPLPVLNTKRGEIMRADATVIKAECDMQQLEQQVSQDVQAASTPTSPRLTVSISPSGRA
jgi:outer membrane protein TolC